MDLLQYQEDYERPDGEGEGESDDESVVSSGISLSSPRQLRAPIADGNPSSANAAPTRYGLMRQVTV
jgi:hypothetical protein